MSRSRRDNTTARASGTPGIAARSLSLPPSLSLSVRYRTISPLNTYACSRIQIPTRTASARECRNT